MVELAGMEAPLGNQVIRTEQGQKKKAFWLWILQEGSKDIQKFHYAF
jgi:hypothetical protein